MSNDNWEKEKHEIYMASIWFHVMNAFLLNEDNLDFKEFIEKCPPREAYGSASWHIAVALKYLERIMPE